MDYFKDAEDVWRTGLTYIRYVVDTAREPFLILDEHLSVISANDSFYRFFMVTKKDTLNKKVYEIGDRQWDIIQLRKLLETILPHHTYLKDFEVEHDFAVIGRKVLLLNARMVFREEDCKETPLIILSMEDVTKQRLLDEKFKEYASDLERKIAERTTELEKKLLEGGKRFDDRAVELEKLNQFMVGREIKMLELKDKIKTLEKKIEEMTKWFNEDMYQGDSAK